MRFAAESAVLGTATVLEVIRESDSDALLALQAANAAAHELRDQQFKRLAQYIIAELARSWK